jgi:hypothetical protein
MFPGFDVTVYPVITLPPLDEGTVKLTVACAFPAVAVTLVGALGTVAGVTTLDTDDAEEFPTTLVATIVKVYGVPFIKPVTMIGETVPVPVKLPGEDVTV